MRISKSQLDEPLATLEEYGMCVRTINILDAVGIIYMRDLVSKTDEELLAVASFGPAMLEETKKAVHAFVLAGKGPTK